MRFDRQLDDKRHITIYQSIPVQSKTTVITLFASVTSVIEISTRFTDRRTLEIATSSSIGRQFSITTTTCRHHENKGKALSFDRSIHSSNSDIADTIIQMETNATTSPRQVSAKQRHEQRRRDKRKALLGSLKRFSVYVLAGIAIGSSILVIDSCTFFSYRDISDSKDHVENDAFQNRFMTSNIDHSENDKKEIDYYEENLSYSPFNGLSEAGVGLFSYFDGDSPTAGSFSTDEVCFRYYDEATDYKLFRISPAAREEGSIDLWVTARACAVFAPIVASLAFSQLLLEWFCGCRMAKCESFITTLLFLMAGFLQFGTFAVAFAPPILFSDDTSYRKERFCFSAESTIQCRIDSGAWFSIASTIAYIILAFASITLRTTRHNPALNEREEETIENKKYCGGCCIVSKSFHDRRIESSTNQKQKRKRSWWKRDNGDTSSDSSFSSSNSSGDESDERKGQPESSSDQNRHAAHGVRWRNNRTSNSRDVEIDRSQEYVDTLGYYEEDLAETIEDEIQIQTIASGNETTAITDFPKDDYDDDSIIKEVTSVETDFVRPGTACCYCAEPIIRSPNRGKKKIAFRKPIIIPNNINRKSFQRVDVLSMLSDDDDYDEEKGGPTEEDTSTKYEETGTTVEDCEAMFMAELESSHCEHYNVENSHWKKGFDFVRS